MKLWKKLCGWPKKIRMTVRDENCNLLATQDVMIENWNEIMTLGEEFAQSVMLLVENENPDEVYWNYEVV